VAKKQLCVTRWRRLYGQSLGGRQRHLVVSVNYKSVELRKLIPGLVWGMPHHFMPFVVARAPLAAGQSSAGHRLKTQTKAIRSKVDSVAKCERDLSFSL